MTVLYNPTAASIDLGFKVIGPGESLDCLAETRLGPMGIPVPLMSDAELQNDTTVQALLRAPVVDPNTDPHIRTRDIMGTVLDAEDSQRALSSAGQLNEAADIIVPPTFAAKRDPVTLYMVPMYRGPGVGGIGQGVSGSFEANLFWTDGVRREAIRITGGSLSITYTSLFPDAAKLGARVTGTRSVYFVQTQEIPGNPLADPEIPGVVLIQIVNYSKDGTYDGQVHASGKRKTYT